MSESTSILDLPTDPIGNNGNNISLSATENNVANHTNYQNSSSNGEINLDQSTISQIVSGLQKASLSGITQLASRDIPMSTSIDPQIQTNYIPPTNPLNKDYIQEYENSSEIVNDYNKNQVNQNSLDEMYNEIQVPLLLAVLYFLFQLPFFRKFLFSYLPILFSNDGNLNINGFLFTSILFGLIFYLLNKITSQFGFF
jgi:hypothetical protein